MIGKAVKVWYTDYSADPIEKMIVGDKNLSGEWKEYAELGCIEEYVSPDLEATNGKYFVALKNAGTVSERVVVGVSACDGADLPNPNDAVLEGNVYYIEP
ncbi:MAG: hypothetical protein J6M02_03740 [Clostridia bacterium]|nr:hypothetical protein [Clostridia bacterium]